MNTYKEKYFKYKQKYNELKNTLQLLNEEKFLIINRKEDIICLLNKKFTKDQILDYLKFLNEWFDFKIFANEQIKLTCARKSITVCSNEAINKFKISNNNIVEKWLNLTHNILDKKEIIDNHFVNTQILNIELLGFELLETDKAIIGKALNTWLLCNVYPAPFSITSILKEKKKRGCNEIKDVNNSIPITIGEHGLSMATYWYRNPPDFINSSELTELIVLSIFHDIFYFIDFVRHDEVLLELFEPYIKSEIVKEVIGSHLDYLPEEFDTENDTKIEKFKKEWTKMDWYLTDTTFENKEDHILPLKFFYKHIGEFLTNK